MAAIEKAGGKAVAVKGDVSKPSEANGIADAAIATFGRLDILVNNSGIYEFGAIETLDEASFHKQFNTNVLGLLLTTQAAVKHLGEGASIINIGSVVSTLHPPQSAVYSATKGGIIAFAKSLAREHARHNINVNCVSPGPTDTPLLQQEIKDDPELIKRMVRLIPFRRVAQPEDQASVVSFLLSKDADYITGQTISCSGGLVMI